MATSSQKCGCFLFHQTPPEYENTTAPCSSRQRSSHISLVSVLLNNRTSLIILNVCMLSSICPLSYPTSLTVSADCRHTCKTLFGVITQLYCFGHPRTHMHIQKHTGCGIFKCWDSALLLRATKGYSYCADGHSLV